MRKTITLAAIIFASFFNAQANVAYAETSLQVSSSNILKTLNEFEALGVKKTGTTANTNALNWLKNKYLSMGYVTTDLSEQSFSARGSDGRTYSGKNLIVTKKGSGANAGKFIIVCGHYDTIVGTGTNDNGSGVATILELAKILKNVPTDYTVKFINFSGEEQGLLGSKAYVSKIIGTGNKSLYFVLNIDEIGGVNGLVNNSITCERDMTSTGGTTNNTLSNTITQQLALHMANYGGLQTKISNAYGSDYMPFEAKGYVITGLFETNETTKKHTSGDTLANMDPNYVANISKGLVGAMLHFSGATVSSATNTAKVAPNNMDTNLQVYPNPTSEVLNIKGKSEITKIEVYNLSGKKIMEKSSGQINVSKLSEGNYILNIHTEGKIYSKSFIKTK